MRRWRIIHPHIAGRFYSLYNKRKRTQIVGGDIASRLAQIFNVDILRELEKITEVGKVMVGRHAVWSGRTLKLHLHENDNFVNKLGVCCADYNEDDNSVQFYTLSRFLDPSVGEMMVIEHLDQGLSQSDAYNKIAGMLHEYAQDVAGQIRLSDRCKRRFHVFITLPC